MMASDDTTGYTAADIANRELMEVFENVCSPYDDFLKLKPTIKADLEMIQQVLQDVKSTKKVELQESLYKKSSGTDPYSMAVEVMPRFHPNQVNFVKVNFASRYLGDDDLMHNNQLVASVGNKRAGKVREDAITHTDIPTSTVGYQLFRANLFRTILRSSLFNSPEERNEFASKMKNQLQQAQPAHTQG